MNIPEKMWCFSSKINDKTDNSATTTTMSNRQFFLNDNGNKK